MIDKLRQAGFGRIAIADDSKENLDAARQLEKRLPEVNFEFYERGDLLVAQIPTRYKELDLILTDRQMETDDAGLDVVETAWEHLVPAVICSGGYQHADTPRVRIAPQIKGFSLPDGMLKDNPDTWYKILEGVVNDCEHGTTSLLRCLLLRKNANPEPTLDGFYGEQMRKICKGRLDEGYGCPGGEQ